MPPLRERHREPLRPPPVRVGCVRAEMSCAPREGLRQGAALALERPPRTSPLTGVRGGHAWSPMRTGAQGRLRPSSLLIANGPCRAVPSPARLASRSCNGWKRAGCTAGATRGYAPSRIIGSARTATRIEEQPRFGRPASKTWAWKRWVIDVGLQPTACSCHCLPLPGHDLHKPDRHNFTA